MRLIVQAVLISCVVALAPAAEAQLVVPGGGGNSPAPSTAPAPSGTITLFNPDQFAQMFTAAGFASKTAVSSDGKTHFVSVTFWPNTASLVLPIACDSNGANCQAYEIATVLSNEQGIGDPWTDAWNSNFYFVKAVKNNTDLIFQMDVVLGPGVTPTYIETTAQVFKTIVDQAATFNPNAQQ